MIINVNKKIKVKHFVVLELRRVYKFNVNNYSYNTINAQTDQPLSNKVKINVKNIQ